MSAGVFSYTATKHSFLKNCPDENKPDTPTSEHPEKQKSP
jgi:hypothetical protein